MKSKSFAAARGLKYGAVSVAALLISLPQVGLAQTAPAGETVVVTGLRGSLAKSIKAKRDNTSIVEVISAEEIGKLPDQSIAESLARLPGLVGQRVNGSAQVISIRGLSPDFSTTLLNGRQQGSLGDSRGVEFDQYPAELLASAMVYKTPDASISGMGLSGTTDMRTVHPLSVNGRSISINARYETSSMDQLNPDVGKDGNRISASYINQFLDDTLGVAIGVSHMDTNRQTEHYKSWYYDNITVGGQEVKSLQGTEIFANSVHQVRDAVVGVVEYKPNDNSHTTLDLYYSKFDQEETGRGVAWFMSPWADDFQINNATISNVGGTQFVSGGTGVNVAPIMMSKLNKRDDSVLALGLNHKAHAAIWDIEADLSYSKSQGDHQDMEMYAGYGATRTMDSVNFSIPTTGVAQFDPALNYADTSKIYLGDNAPWGGWGHDGAIRFPHVEDTFTAFDVKAKTPLEGTAFGKVFSTFEVGLNALVHEKTKSVDDNDLFLKVRPDVNTQARTLIDNSFYIAPTSLAFGGFGDIASFNMMDVIARYYNIVPIDDQNNWNKDWGVTENILTLHAKADIDTEIMGRSLKGNVGFQYISTETQSRGYMVNGDKLNNKLVPVPIVIDNKYDDLLPSMNLVLSLAKNHKLRFGAAKQMARARTDDLRANMNISLSQIQQPSDPDNGKYRWSGEGGNPTLDPWRATAYDLSYEWYVNSRSYVSLAGFYKDVDTYIYNQDILADFSNAPNPLNKGPVVSNYGNYRSPQNGEGGYIKGIEVATTLDLGSFVPVLEGFGFAGSWSQNWTDISPNGPGNSNRLPGFSGQSYNVTAYYENHGFQFRISQRWRDAYRADAAGLFATRTQLEFLEDKVVDAQIGYKFPEGPLNGLSLVLQAYNLGNNPFGTRTGTTTADGAYLPEIYDRFGTQYLFGINYKF